MEVLDRISGRINLSVEWIVAFLGISMSVVVILQVFFRYVLNQSLFWSEELARYMLVWLTFLGATVAYRRGAHPGIDMMTSRMPASLKLCCGILVHTVSLVFFGIMVYYGIRFSWFVRLQISPALNVPKWIIFSAIPLSGIILFLHGITFLVSDISGRRT